MLRLFIILLLLTSVGVTGNPQLQVLTNNGQQLDTVTIDAVAAWGGIGANQEYINLLLIPRDNRNIRYDGA